MEGRARKPYPPANVKINHSYYPNEISDKNITIAWSHRNKKTQNKKLGFFMGDIEPENETKYQVSVYLNEQMLIDEVVTDTIKTVNLPGSHTGTLHIKIATILKNEISIPYLHSTKIQNPIVFEFNDAAFNPTNLIFIFE